MQEEQQAWSIQRSELRMTLAELSAESSQLRDQLKKRVLLMSNFLDS